METNNESEQKVEEADKTSETTNTETNSDDRLSLIETANIAAKRLEDANKKSEEILAKAILSGRAAAGQAPVKPKEETAKEYAERVMGVRKPKL